MRELNISEIEEVSGGAGLLTVTRNFLAGLGIGQAVSGDPASLPSTDSIFAGLIGTGVPAISGPALALFPTALADGTLSGLNNTLVDGSNFSNLGDFGALPGGLPPIGAGIA